MHTSFILFIILIMNSLAVAEIMDQSANQSVCEGSDATLFVRASGSITNYTWLKDSKELNFDSPQIQFEEVEFDDAGTYVCIVSEETATATLNHISEPMVLDINQKTQVIDIQRNIRFDGEEQIWSFWADVQDDDLGDNIFRWEFDEAIGKIEDTPGFSGINTNYLTVRFKYQENNFDYVRKLRFIADGDCGADTAFAEVEQINFELISNRGDTTICENQIVNFSYSINYTIPKVLDSSKLTVGLFNQNGLAASKDLELDADENSTEIEFNIEINSENAGDFYAIARHSQMDFDISTGTSKISYYPEIIITDRSNEPFRIKAGQPIKLRIWAEGSIAEYIWIKEPNDTLKIGDDPFYEVLASRPSDAGSYRSILKSQCGDTTLNFTVVIETNEIEENITLSVPEIQNYYKTNEAKFYSLTGREIDPRFIRKGFYFVIKDGKTEKLIVR